MRFTLGIFIALLTPAASGAEWVPPGFEALDDPQITVVDVHYGGVQIGSALVQFTFDEVKFLEPEQLAGTLPDLLDEAEVARLLGAAFATNDDQVCRSSFQQDCGVLRPETIDIIFDRDQLALWLFVAPQLLQTRAAQDTRFLPDSDAPLSLRSSNAMYFSGSSASSYDYNLYSNTQIAWSENHIVSRASITPDSVLVDQVSFGRNYRGRQFEAGLFRANADGFSFLATEQFLGVGLQSSLLSLQAVEQYQGSRIELFLPTRSRVELYSEGRLLHARFYDAGNQLLDTSSLPSGSYELEIRVADSAGSERIEYRYFSKTSRLPPTDSPQYFLQYGHVYQPGVPLQQQSADVAMLRGGINRRVGDRTGVRAGFAATPGHWVAETGFFRVGENLEIQGGLALDDTNATAREFDLFWRPGPVQLGMSYRSVTGGSAESLLRENRRQYQLSVDVPTQAGTVSLFTREVGSDRMPAQQSKGVRWRSNYWRAGDTSGSAAFEISHNSGEVLAMFGVSLRLGRGNRIHSIAPQLYRDAFGTSMRGVMESAWQPMDRNNTLVAFSAASQGQDSLEARVSREGDLLGSDVTARYDVDTGGTTVFGRLESSFAIGTGGAVVSGRQSADSAFSIGVDGATPDVTFEILVDGSPQGYVRSGQRVLVPVVPFKTYEVELRSVGDRIINLDKGAQKRVLYPGNVVAMDWQASSVIVGYGRIVDESGAPIADALVGNASGLAITEKNGMFQAELDSNVRQLQLRSEGRNCVVALPAMDPASMVASLGTLVCKTVVKPANAIWTDDEADQ